MREAVLKGIGIAALLGLAIGGMGCAPGDDSEVSSDGVVEHPVEARIPYLEQAVPVKKEQTLADLEDPPEALKTLATFLDDPGAIDTTRLDVLVEESRTVEIVSVAPNWFVLLAGHPENRLFEHNLRTDTTMQIARRGSGPGQLKFTEAVAGSDSSLHIARQDRRIDRFDCADAPCTYQETIRLRFSPMAVTAAGPHLAVVGSPMLGRKGMDMEDWSGAIKVLGAAGSIQQTLGRTYQADHFLVLSDYIRNGSLIYSSALNQFVRVSQKLPLIWAYGENGTRESVWAIDDFKPLSLKYDPSEQSIHKRYEEGYSTLRLQGPIAGRFVVATVRHKTLPSEASDLTGRGNDYYALDLTSGDTYFLGRDTPREGIVDRLVLVTNEHQVLIENGRVAVITEPTYSKSSGIQARSKRVPEPQEF